ncbi:MAG: PhoH family protein [Phycisphaerae bacterium]|nr:PhoH family protein [Phycisphaerae bacterium]
MQLFGPSDANLRVIREMFGVNLSARNGRLRIRGPRNSVAQTAELLDLMQKKLKKKEFIDRDDVMQLVTKLTRTKDENEDPDRLDVYFPGRSVEARTPGQLQYLRAIETADMVFCTGPAGTGKTYLAVALAVSLLKRGVIRRIILVRPAVEAGEKLGFLPGDMQAKVNPYLRPLMDALGDMMPFEQMRQFLHNDIIEVVPLAFMRGRTLNNALVILDEAQNTTVSQMLMFLTRMGNESKMIITGDASQTDLEDSSKSGLRDALRRLKGIKGINQVELTELDIVRHKLVQNIVRAYGDFDKA